MVNRAWMTVQDMVNAWVDSRPSFWETNATSVGSLNNVSLGDASETLKAHLNNLKPPHRLTNAETTQMKQMTPAIAAVSPQPVPSYRRRVAASR